MNIWEELFEHYGAVSAIVAAFSLLCGFVTWAIRSDEKENKRLCLCGTPLQSSGPLCNECRIDLQIAWDDRRYRIK